MEGALKVLAFMVLLAVSLAFAGAGEQPAEDGREVVDNVCNTCHTHERLCANLGQGKAWWRQTTKRMRGNGAPITKAQAKASAAFLTMLEPGSGPVCK